MDVYFDDFLAKNGASEKHLADLLEAFIVLQEYQMKLNPVKCAFWVGSRKFLGFMVSKRGIKVNSEKPEAILYMTTPRNIKEV